MLSDSYEGRFIEWTSKFISYNKAFQKIRQSSISHAWTVGRTSFLYIPANIAMYRRGARHLQVSTRDNFSSRAQARIEQWSCSWFSMLKSSKIRDYRQETVIQAFKSLELQFQREYNFSRIVVWTTRLKLSIQPAGCNHFLESNEIGL